MEKLHNELKKEFQIERMILFSDAVFAIAITLLVLEIKVPELEDDYSEKALLLKMVRLLPKFFGFLLSFFLIGTYWVRHHNMFGFVTNYTRKLLWLNLIFLLSIVLMPFSTGIYGEYSGSLDGLRLKTPLIIYVLNICFTVYMTQRLWNYISNTKNNVAEELPPSEMIRSAKIRGFVVAIVFLASIPVAYLEPPYLSRYVFFLIFPVMRIAQKISEKKKTNTPKQS